MSATLTAEYLPTLTPPQNPTTPPPTQPGLDDIALVWIASGDTSAGQFALAADPAFYRSHLVRESDGTAIGDLFASITEHGPAAAAEAVIRTRRRAEAMRLLETAGWTQAKALDALRNRTTRTAVAA